MACKDVVLDPPLLWVDQNTFKDPLHKQRRELQCVKEELRSGGEENGVFRVPFGKLPYCTDLVKMIKDCGNKRDVHTANRIHAKLHKEGLLEQEICLGNTLISTYAKSGLLAKARQLFDALPTRDVVTWNAIIAAYAQHGLGDEALSCYEVMQEEGLPPNTITYICVLKACGSIGDVEKGKEIHVQVSRQKLLEKESVVGTAVVDMYAKCGALARAQEVLNQLPAQSIGAWNALISGYMHHGLHGEALNCFRQMRCLGLSPSSVTFICILKACSSIEAVEEMHAEVRSWQALWNKDIVLGTVMVDAYIKCGALAKAKQVFDELSARDVVIWTVLIDGYTESGLGEEALRCFMRMQDEGVPPSAVTYICVLKACCIVGDAEKGEEIHREVCRQGLLDRNVELGNAVVDMYVKCGKLKKAQGVFDELLVRDVVTWTSLMAGYADEGLAEEALSCLDQMQDDGLSPDPVTFICILKSCGSVGSVKKGEAIHTEVSKQGLLQTDVELGNALMDMYSKCGTLSKAQEVFNELPNRNIITWTTLIAAYAQVGKVRSAFELFSKMVGTGLEPNGITFLVLLIGCSHAGLVVEGQMCYEAMASVCSIIPTVEHCICMVDLLTRAGHFDQTISIVERVPASGSFLPWLAVMGACKWANLELGRSAFERAVQSDESLCAAYVCMSNLYATIGMQEGTDEVEAMRMKKGAWSVMVPLSILG